jgi:hypothetical protein
VLDIHLMGKTRALILRELLVNASKPLGYNQLLARAGCGPCAKPIIDGLVEWGIVIETRVGQRRLLEAAKDHHYYMELRALLDKCCAAQIASDQAAASSDPPTT